ncbi:MAG: transporter permease subunit [Proteobacteria bacterium]|nr:transporter permease subunit [Pseudomonadota bacterium]
MTDLAPLSPFDASPAAVGRIVRREPVDWTGIAFLTGLAVVVLLPLIVTAVWAFAEIWRFPAIVPQRMGLGYWQDTLSRNDVWQALWLSLSLTTTVTVISAAICFPAAYAFARLDFPGRNLLFLAFLSVQAFPKFGLIVATATIFLTLHLVGTFWGVVLIQLVGTLLYMIWIPVSAFQGVDRRLEEAARDVGAGPMRVFWFITLPQALPTLFAALLITFVSTFYETDAAWLIGLPNVRTMPMVMISFINNALEVQYGAVLFVFLWVPSFVLMLAARRVMGADAFAKGLGG